MFKLCIQSTLHMLNSLANISQYICNLACGKTEGKPLACDQTAKV